MVRDHDESNKPLKPEKNLKNAPLPPLPFAHQITKKEDEAKRTKELKRIAHKEGPLTVDEARILLEDMKEKRDTLKRKLDEMYRQRGVTPEYLRMYMSNPSNFTPQEWASLQKERQAFIDSLNLSDDASGKASAAYVSANQSKSPSDQAKPRKKTGAAQRRGWLPMR